MRRILVVPALAAGLLSAGCISVPTYRVERGAPVALNFVSGPTQRGELLAVSVDSLWIRDDSLIGAVALPALVRVTIDRQRYGAKHGLLRGASFGFVSGIALYVACRTAEEASDCGGIVLVSTILGSLVGVLAVPSLDNLRFLVVPPTVETLAPWARYPQGMPR